MTCELALLHFETLRSGAYDEDPDEDSGESLPVWDAEDIWLSNGMDEGYTFGYTEGSCGAPLRRSSRTQVQARYRSRLTGGARATVRGPLLVPQFGGRRRSVAPPASVPRLVHVSSERRWARGAVDCSFRRRLRDRPPVTLFRAAGP